MKNASLVLICRLRDQSLLYPNRSLYVCDYLEDCGCIGMDEQRVTDIRTRDASLKLRSQEQGTPVPGLKVWLKSGILVTL